MGLIQVEESWKCSSSQFVEAYFSRKGQFVASLPVKNGRYFCNRHSLSRFYYIYGRSRFHFHNIMNYYSLSSPPLLLTPESALSLSLSNFSFFCHLFYKIFS